MHLHFLNKSLQDVSLSKFVVSFMNIFEDEDVEVETNRKKIVFLLLKVTHEVKTIKSNYLNQGSCM